MGGVMAESQDVFDKHHADYCAQVATVDLDSIGERLGLVKAPDNWTIPFFNQPFPVSPDGIVDVSGNRPDYLVFVILAKYILLCPERQHADADWVSFREFKRASHFTNVNFFASDTERAIAKQFSGNLTALKTAGQAMGGVDPRAGMSYDLCLQFDALPRVAMLLLFNDGDADFPAKCTVLFQKQAEYYLDPESLAMTGAVLARHLKRLADNGPS